MNDPFDVSLRRRLTLKPGKERVVSNRHPWVFTGAIANESGPAESALADLVDGRGTVIASGFYSAHSQIRLRALTFGKEELTADLLRRRIAGAIARRMSRLDAGHDATRLVHAEGDDLSGLVVDRYGDMLVIEIANAGVEKIRPLIVDALRQELSPRGIYFKNDLPVRKLEQLPQQGEWIGEGEPSATISESGLKFRVEPVDGQKTGFFLDQRENRAIARTLAGGRRVLNLFSYSGAFGVHAIAGGAASVVNVDGSGRAIELARTNHELNAQTNAAFVVANAFEYVRERVAAAENFDFVVCDPPAFAKSHGDIDRAARGYKDINLYAMKLVAPDGMLMTFSCSGHMSMDLFQKVVFSAALDAGRHVSFVRRLTAAPDHPVSLYCPEGEYLKGFLLQVR